MSRRSGWTRSSLAFLVAALVALLAPAMADEVVLTLTKCSQCAHDFAACAASNADYQKGFSGCIKLNDCTPRHTNCDEECLHACATCRSYWGYLVTTCRAANVSCLESCVN